MGCRILYIGYILVFCLTLTGCNGQNQTPAQNQVKNTDRVGGPCEAGYCEIMYEGMPTEINSVDTSAGWYEKGQKLLVTGKVFKLDGKTPDPGVIIYYHHTDNNGFYSPGKARPGDDSRHGHLRGWVKSDENGKYAIYTIRPAAYPDTEFPAHIHLMIKEPDIGNEYFIEDINFDDDKLLMPYLKKRRSGNMGGSGIVRVLLKDDLQIAVHNIVTGLNIPDYPAKPSADKQSGLNIGEDQPSFDPQHAYGPDKGSHACPVCKYGRYHGIIYFVGNNPDWKEIKSWLTFLEQESIKRQKYLKVYFVYGNEKSFNPQSRQKELEQLGKELDIQKTALTYVPSFSDDESNVNESMINQKVENTFIVYQHRNIIDKYVNLEPTVENFNQLSNSLDATRNEFFDLPVPKHE